MSGCGDPQWSHKRGKFGCKECGCGKYLPPAGVVESDPASPVPGVIEQRPDDAEPGTPVGGFEPAEPADVDLPVEFTRPVGYASDIEQPERDRLAGRRLTDPVETLDVKRRRRREPYGPVVATDPAAQAESARLAAEVDKLLAEPESSEVPGRVELPAAEVERLHAELTEALRELGRERTARRDTQARVAELEAHLARALTHIGPVDPARVLIRYDADQCVQCGFRTTVPGLMHHHPLQPVTVLVVKRAEADAEATNPTKE